MTVASTTNRIAYAGNGATLAFSFPYFFTKKADLLVLGTDASGVITTYALTTHYTIAAATAANGTYPSGSTVTFLIAPATGTTITLIRVPDFLQATHWVDADADPAAVKELAFDKLTLEVQRLKEQMARAVVLPDGFTATFDPTLPPVLSPGDSLFVNSAGTAWQSGTPTAFTLANNQSSAADVTGLLFDGTLTQSFVVEYFIYRKTTSTGATELSSRGMMIGAYSPVAATWEMSVGPQVGDAGITFSITAAGQVQYSSTNITGTASVSKMTSFKRTLGVLT